MAKRYLCSAILGLLLASGGSPAFSAVANSGGGGGGADAPIPTAFTVRLSDGSDAQGFLLDDVISILVKQFPTPVDSGPVRPLNKLTIIKLGDDSGLCSALKGSIPGGAVSALITFANDTVSIPVSITGVTDIVCHVRHDDEESGAILDDLDDFQTEKIEITFSDPVGFSQAAPADGGGGGEIPPGGLK